MFDGFDFSDFWEESDYSAKHYVSDPPTDELIAEIEQEPGCKIDWSEGDTD